MSPVWLGGVAAAALVALAALVAALAGGAAAAFVVLAVGAALIIGWHLYQLDRLLRWASGPIDAQVPEGRGAWGRAFTALYRRMRLRSARQRDLRLALDRFESGAEAMPEGVVVLDGNNRIEWANARAGRHLGIDARKDRGAPIVNLVRQPAFVQYLAGRETGEPLVMQSARESALTLSLQIVPFGVEEKLLMSRDITRLEAVARVRRDFIANVSHELKTPLTVLSGFIETLADVPLDEAQRRRCLALMNDQAQSMQRLVNDLLTLSTLESEESPLREAEFAIVPLLLALSADAKALSAGRHEIVLTINNAATVRGSRDELASAFGNLISNAVRYTPDGGRIALDWRVNVDGGEFSVADTGIGIAADDILRLTERFYRVDHSRSRVTGGTGLGLAIVKHVLMRHQGELRIESVPERGSRFTARLPVRRVAAEAGEPPAPAAEGAAESSTSTASPR
ncbi:MAG: phosphate regulon sensor histidine kinase PhoR [Betaproteobacteria bacterium]